VDNSAITNLFDDGDREMLVTYATQAAIALDNAQLFSATDQQRVAHVEELRQLRRIDWLLSETLEIDKVINLTLEWALRFSGADTAHYGMVRGDHITTVQNYPNETQPFLLDRIYPQTLDVVKNGKTRVIFDERRRQNVMFMPVINPREKTVGGVLVLRRNTGMFTEEQAGVWSAAPQPPSKMLNSMRRFKRRIAPKVNSWASSPMT
jgi:hypothetical protein